MNTGEEDNAGENTHIERTETVTEQAIAEVHESDNEEIETSESVDVKDIIDENVLSSEIANTNGVGILTYGKMQNTVVGLLEDENKVKMRDEDTLKCQVFLKQGLRWK